MAAYKWVPTTAHAKMPDKAFIGGSDVGGDTIYVGRAYHNGDLIPAKVIPKKNSAYVSYFGQEYAKDSFEVLCGECFDWVQGEGGVIPENALKGGETDTVNETLYIGRFHHSNSLTVGKVHPSHGCCYIPFNGKEINNRRYEILVLRSGNQERTNEPRNERINNTIQ